MIKESSTMVLRTYSEFVSIWIVYLPYPTPAANPAPIKKLLRRAPSHQGFRVSSDLAASNDEAHVLHLHVGVTMKPNRI